MKSRADPSSPGEEEGSGVIVGRGREGEKEGGWEAPPHVQERWQREGHISELHGVEFDS